MRAVEHTYLGNTYQREITPFAAALATLDAYADGMALARMRAVGERLIAGLNSVFAQHSTPAQAFAHPTMFDVLFADPSLGHAFFQQMWGRGFLMQYGGRFMPSAATTDEDVDAAVETADAALTAAREETPEATNSRGGGPGWRDSDVLAAAVPFAEERFVATPATVEKWFGGVTRP